MLQAEQLYTASDRPRVAVIIAAFNVEACIGRAIASVQAQTVSPAEILVVDDGSSDGTAFMVQRLAQQDSRIKLLRTPSNSGPGAARNLAIEAANADWIAVLDSDDAWRPRRLERLLEVAVATGCEIVADNYTRIDDSSGNEAGEAFYESRETSEISAARFVMSEHPLRRVRFGLLKPMVRLDFLRAQQIRYATDIRLAEDFHFFMRVLLEGGSGILLNEAHYMYTLPRSPSDGRASRGSRTRHRLMDRTWVAEDLIARYGQDPNTETAMMLRRYHRWMRESAMGAEARNAWAAGQRLQACRLALANPRGMLFYLWATPRIKRFRARFEPRLARAPY
jgi:succinoglycan biosynthesis protein ExoO